MVEVWQVEEGLPQISVTSIAQTPDGYLWLGTFNGLARFDGMRFKVFDEGNTPALGRSGIYRLDVDDEGGLWITTEGGGLVRMARGQFRAYGSRNGLPQAGAAVLLRDAANRLLLLDREGALHGMEKGELRSLNRDDRLQVGDEPCLLLDGSGPAWIGQHGKAARSFDRPFPVLAVDGTNLIQTNLIIHCAAASRSGGYWLATTTGVYRLQGGRLQPRVAPLPSGTNRLELMVEDGQGDCWAGAWRSELVRWDSARGEWQHFGAGRGLADIYLNVLFNDCEGNLWAGTGQGGLHRFKRRLCRMYDTQNPSAGNTVTSVTQDRQGRIWAGVNGRGLHSLEAGQLVRVAEPAALRSFPLTYSVLVDREDAMWIGLYGRTALRLHRGNLSSFELDRNLSRATPWALFQDRAGSVWLGTEDGLWRYQEGSLKRYGPEDGLSHGDVRALAEDSAGTLYIGTAGGGLNRLQAGRFSCLTERDGLADNHISALYVDRQDTVWIGTMNGGLSRFKNGSFTTLTAKDGLPSNTVGAIIEDEQDHLWFGSNRGLIRLSRHSLEDYAEGGRKMVSPDVFTPSDGLSTIACGGGGQPACCRTRDGRLWFTTVKGLAVVDPSQLPLNPLPPKVVIEEVMFDDRQLDLFTLNHTRPAHSSANSSALTVPRRTHRVEFRFTGISLLSPEKVRFRYRLEPFDDQWIEAGLRRSALYTRIPPGQYRFQVTACNNTGVWNKAGAVLDLTVLRPWWMTWWSRGIALAVLAGVVFWTVEARVRRVKRDHAAQRALSQRLIETQEAERKRIAAELHDSLGQDLLVIKNRAVMGLQAAAGTPQSAEQFNEISRVVSRSLAEVRQISHDLRPYQLDRLGLSNALQAMVANVAAASGIRCVAEVDSIDGLLLAAMEIHCYRVAQELLNNVVKHSHASAARVAARRLDGSIRLVVEDDGCGFDLEAARSRASGAGLTDIAERVRILEGTLRCDSQRAKGTRWTIVIPVPRALAV